MINNKDKKVVQKVVWVCSEEWQDEFIDTPKKLQKLLNDGYTIKETNVSTEVASDALYYMFILEKEI